MTTREERYALDDAEPWAMNLVVRLEKGESVWHEDLCGAAAVAVCRLLGDERASGNWAGAIERFEAGRIRKLCRRARGARWEALAELEHVEVRVGTASLRAFVPVAVADQPDQLARLQMSGTDLERRPGYLSGDEASGMRIWMSPVVEMSSAKAAVQAAHGAQLGVLARLGYELGAPGEGHLHQVAYRDFLGLREGKEGDRGLLVGQSEPADWEKLVARVDAEEAGVLGVRDAGFTEVVAGSLTAIVQWEC